MNDSPSSGERTGRSPNRRCRKARAGVIGVARLARQSERNRLERRTEDGESPVREARSSHSHHLSMPEHEEFRLNCRGPSRKAKYYRETDSERVP